ncbi:hypothetical protein N7512_000323 [Penicillium capsulatum]|nr:hypothetical protein N7512_000323 [Penicillium capsulatum]
MQASQLYIFPLGGESITTIPRTAAGAETSLSPSAAQLNSPGEGQAKQTNGHLRPTLVAHRSFDRGSDAGSDPTRSPSETATSSFPLNDVDYESDPAAVVQELNNLAAIRRMSMDVAAAGDPDLPGYGNSFSIPSTPPSPTADENDASRLFWVPASLHPELAPKEFKSFLESKADLIKRKSGDYSSLSPERHGSDSSLRRKRSMLSRQIDNSAGYTDGADRLEHQRSQSNKRDGMLSPNLQQLETLVDDTKSTTKDSSLVRAIQNVEITPSEDKPILPPAPPGGSLRRSTRTQYKKGSLKKGEKPPYSKRVGRGLSESAGSPSPVTPSLDDAPILGSTRVSTDSDPPATRTARAPSAPSHSAAYASAAAAGSTFDSIIDKPEAEQQEEEGPSAHTQAENTFDRSDSTSKTNVASYARQWHSRISSNGRSTLNIPQSEQKVPSIVETPPNDSGHTPVGSAPQSNRTTGRESPSSYSTKSTPAQESVTGKRSPTNRQPAKEPTTSLNDFANNPQMIPGNSMRTDSLSFIPTMTEERKPEERKSEGKKSKKDSEGGRKSSWHWLLGSEEKDKDKKKDKDGDSKKTKSRLAEKVHGTSRPESPQSSLDHSQRGRESLILDRLDPKLEEERRKDNVRRTSGDKKEKDGIFSTIFGGGRKKHSGEGHHRKNSSRNLSPDPPMRELRADVDYPWTRFSILEERAIYRMAHIKLANPRRALHSQVLLSNFMYSYLEKVQQMHPQMVVASSGSQRSSKSRDQPDEYLQYQRYQEAQEQQQQQYGESAYDDSSMYDYDDDPHDRYQDHQGNSKHGYDSGAAYNSSHYQYGHSPYGDHSHLDDDDDDDMW